MESEYIVEFQLRCVPHQLMSFGTGAVTNKGTELKYLPPFLKCNTNSSRSVCDALSNHSINSCALSGRWGLSLESRVKFPYIHEAHNFWSHCWSQ